MSTLKTSRFHTTLGFYFFLVEDFTMTANEFITHL